MLLEDVQEEWEDAYFEILDTLYEEATPGLDCQTGEKAPF